MCGLFLYEIIKGFRHYARILIFLSWFWELFWEFLQVQLLFLAVFPAFGLVFVAVLGIFAGSATFSRNFSGFWAEFGVLF